MHVLLKTKIVVAPVCIEVCVPHSTAEGSPSVFKQQGKREYTHCSLHGELAVQMLWKPLFSPLIHSREWRGSANVRKKNIPSLALARHASCIYWYFSCMLLKTRLNLDCQSDKPHHLPFVLSGAPILLDAVCFIGPVGFPSWGFEICPHTSDSYTSSLTHPET